jgi:preprotein translocase subunit YajC
MNLEQLIAIFGSGVKSKNNTLMSTCMLIAIMVMMMMMMMDDRSNAAFSTHNYHDRLNNILMLNN